ncbi:MAG: aspartate kinase [Bacteroidales bacterium]|nr:aspartate kinase [Bacteroidales bacterium]
MIIIKFGGTSVQNEEAIGRVISIVKSRLGEKPLVVVSALARVTRLLCTIAEEAEAQREDAVKDLLSQLRERHFNLSRNLLAGRPDLLKDCLEDVEALISSLETFVGGVCLLGELSSRSEARIISTGELLSSTIISYAFNANGISCHWIDARRMITTDDNYLNARPDMVVTEANIKRIVGLEYRGADLVLTQGFVASTEKGATSVLGFEGSDYSAAIFGMALGAERVEIWTDVDGIRSADPRVIGNTRKIDVISYEEAAEMAAMGARVLHPLTIEPARKKNIPILVLNSTNQSCDGTLVTRGDQSPDGPKSVAFKEDVLFIKVISPKLDGVTRMLGKVFASLYPRRIPVTLAKATESEVFLVMPEERVALQDALEEIGKWADVTVYRDKAFISVVGRNIVGFEGLGDKVISVSGKVHLANVSANMMSENFVIDRDRLQVTLESLHDYIFKTGA